MCKSNTRIFFNYKEVLACKRTLSFKIRIIFDVIVRSKHFSNNRKNLTKFSDFPICSHFDDIFHKPKRPSIACFAIHEIMRHLISAYN